MHGPTPAGTCAAAACTQLACAGRPRSRSAAAGSLQLSMPPTLHLPAGGSLVSHLSSYASVIDDSLQMGEPYAGMRAALADPALVQPLLLGLAEAPAALRGESSPMHAREAWELLHHVGLILWCIGRDTNVCRRLLGSSARPAGPALMELVRDAAAALPRSRPKGVPLQHFAGAYTCLCGTLSMPLPAVLDSGGAPAPEPLAAVEWAAVEAFTLLAPVVRRMAFPPSRLGANRLEQAGNAVYFAVLGTAALLDRAPGTCTPPQLQLALQAAWEAACQLPLLATSGGNPEHETAAAAGRWPSVWCFHLLAVPGGWLPQTALPPPAQQLAPRLPALRLWPMLGRSPWSCSSSCTPGCARQCTPWWPACRQSSSRLSSRLSSRRPLLRPKMRLPGTWPSAMPHCSRPLTAAPAPA